MRLGVYTPGSSPIPGITCAPVRCQGRNVRISQYIVAQMRSRMFLPFASRRPGIGVFRARRSGLRKIIERITHLRGTGVPARHLLGRALLPAAGNTSPYLRHRALSTRRHRSNVSSSPLQFVLEEVSQSAQRTFVPLFRCKIYEM
jgi:hypothetical protein